MAPADDARFCRANGSGRLLIRPHVSPPPNNCTAKAAHALAHACKLACHRYWEEGLPVASEYAQWAGWRNILAQLHTKRGGRACAGSRCVIDNRQANHGWGAWMWALGGTYAEPLMSDEQPGSWAFYEADLHTDRLAGNKQRQVAYASYSAIYVQHSMPCLYSIRYTLNSLALYTPYAILYSLQARSDEEGFLSASYSIF